MQASYSGGAVNKQPGGWDSIISTAAQCHVVCTEVGDDIVL